MEIQLFAKVIFCKSNSCSQFRDPSLRVTLSRSSLFKYTFMHVLVYSILTCKGLKRIHDQELSFFNSKGMKGRCIHTVELWWCFQLWIETRSPEFDE
jgi:hypothetical protein